MEIDLRRDAFMFCYDEKRVTAVQIERAIERLGFRARPAPPEEPARPPEPRGTIVPEPVAAALARARESGRPVLVNFYADWCAPCKVLENRILPDPHVRQALERFLLLHVDTDRFPEAGRYFAVEAMPALVVLDGDGAEMRRFVGLMEPEELAELLSRIAAAYE